MKRVQVQLTERQLKTLRDEANATGRPLAAVVREALDEWIARAEREAKWDRAMSIVGKYHSGLRDLGEKHDEYLGDEW